MIDKLAGLPTQIRQLEKRLKEMDASKVKPALVKEITDTIKNLKDMLKEKQDKREQRKKDKESATEVQKEAITVPNATEIGAVAPNAVVPGQEGQPEATPTTPSNQNQTSSSCPLCGGLKFPDEGAYQQHMQFTHASDVMPTTPGQKLDKTVAAVDPVTVNKVETDPRIAPGIIVPDSVKHDQIVDQVEKDPKIAPHIISEQEPQFKLDDQVKPIRGGESKGKVMRWDGKPNDLVYVMWESGPLADRDTFGGYYPHDLAAVVEEPVEAAAAPVVEEPVCQKCADTQAKHGDLRSNYDAMLSDLKEERDIHYTQGNHSWVARLDQRIADLEKSIAEKYPKEAEYQPKTGQPCSCRPGQQRDNCPSCEGTGMKVDFKKIREADGGSLKKAEGGPELIRQINKATSGHGYDSTVYSLTNGRFQQNVPLKINDTHVRMQQPENGLFEVKYPGADWRPVLQPEFDQWFAEWKRINETNNQKEGAAENAEQLTIMDHTPPRANTSADEGGKDSHDEFQDEWAMPVTAETKINVLKRELLATPITGSKAFGGYDISADGKKLFNIKGRNNQPLSKKQLEFCAQIEFTRGMKQAKLVEKIANLEAGSTVFIMAHDKTSKRVKFASLEHGYRGWASASKFAYLIKEGQMMQHKDHIDNTYGNNGKQMLVDCPNGSGNMVWLQMGELLPINPPPATPESLNDVESKATMRCEVCNKSFKNLPEFGSHMEEKHPTKKAAANRPLLTPEQIKQKMKNGESHCSNCGRFNPVNDEGYTSCCNEPVCSGTVNNEWAFGRQPYKPCCPFAEDLTGTKDLNASKEKGFSKVVRPKSGHHWQCSDCAKSFESHKEFKKHDSTHKKASLKLTASARNPINWNGKDYFGVLADLDGNIISGYTYEEGEEAGWDLYFTTQEDIAWNNGELVYVFGSQLTPQWGETYGHGGLQGTPEAERETLEPQILAKVQSQVSVNPTDPKSVKSDLGFPLSYFARPEAKERAEQFGLIDVEDGDLTPEGLAAKQREMVEGHDVETKVPCAHCGQEADPRDMQTDAQGNKFCHPGCYTASKTWPGWTARAASNKESLQTQLPKAILPQRGDVNPTHLPTIDPMKGPSDEDVQQKAYEMFKTHWDALGSKEQDMVYKALGVTSSMKKKADEFEDDENGTGIEPGDLVDFGAYGQLYVVSLAGRSSRVTDLPEERFNPNAPGWYYNITGNEPILEKGSSVAREDIDEDLDAEAAKSDIDGKRVCKHCGDKFTPQEEGNIYCSKNCWKEEGAQIVSSLNTLVGEQKGPCPICGTDNTSDDHIVSKHPDYLVERDATNPARFRIVKRKSSLNKIARVVEREDGWHVMSEKGKNLGGPYKSKEKAVERLRQVEYFKHHSAQRPFSRKVVADVMTDLTTHVTDMKGRIDQVQERLQTVPAVKTADVVTDETIVTNDPNAIIDPTNPLSPEQAAAGPDVKNIVPTDNDNLAVPVVAPTSPLPAGQKWVFDTQFNQYVAMPDPAAAGKQI